MAGWDATGLLAQHWGKVGGRDKLAAKTGIQGSTLSAYNTGTQRLGIKNAKRIARALKVTIYDLGAPTEAQAAGRSATVLGRVEALEVRLDAFQRKLDELLRLRGDEA